MKEVKKREDKEEELRWKEEHKTKWRRRKTALPSGNSTDATSTSIASHVTSPLHP